ncbi:hypothetical protein MTR67_018983 [Solanum verrucosum]|uniref:Integrase catalytic domain-containing protein n=1 Tax=Solanum verrucosum TaxID=315347 RepID=A0AAF0TU98_SOLVR|nr:hypothetical protein MTR67_018983 [Solanum verrucosum]
MSVLYHPDKVNVVADSLSRLSMGSVAHVEDDKKELVWNVHRLSRLGVQLVDSTNGGVMVHNGSESSFVKDVKAKQVEHQKLGGLSQDICIPTWKWEDLNMDFIVRLPHTRRQYDSIRVIIDRMTKSVHFVPINISNSAEDYSKLYVREMVKFHRVPLSIIPNRGTQFTFQFWKSFQNGLGTSVKLKMTFHPQIDGQVECTIKTLEYMLRACVIDFKGNWDDHLPLIEFSYNNSYHSSIGKAPFEELYGRRCRSPIGTLRRLMKGTIARDSARGEVDSVLHKAGSSHEPLDGSTTTATTACEVLEGSCGPPSGGLHQLMMCHSMDAEYK